MKITRMTVAWLLGLALAAPAVQAVETSIAYQGVLRDSQGAVLATLQQTVEFRLYKEASGGNALWGRSIAVLLDSTGLFNVELADSAGGMLQNTSKTNLVDALKDGRSGSLFVGLTVTGSSGEIAPRQKLLMVPYSSYAADVDRASGEFTVADLATLDSAKVSKTLEVKGPTTLVSANVSSNLTVRGNLAVSKPGAISGYGTIPLGGIIMWSGKKIDIPDGWALCDGSGDTPDLRNRFIFGGDCSDTDEKGGSDTVTLSVDNIPPHNHLYAGDDQIENLDWRCTTPGGATNRNRYDATGSVGANFWSLVYYTSTTGGGKPFTIRPLYYRLAFIMRVK